MFCYENNLVYPVYTSNEKLIVDVLLISHAISILNILTDSFSVRQGVTIKKALLQVLLKML